MTDQTITTPGDAPADTTPAAAPAAPAAPARGSLVSFTRNNGWGPEQVSGVVLGTDGSGEFAIVAPLPDACAIPVGDLH